MYWENFKFRGIQEWICRVALRPCPCLFQCLCLCMFQCLFQCLCLCLCQFPCSSRVCLYLFILLCESLNFVLDNVSVSYKRKINYEFKKRFWLLKTHRSDFTGALIDNSSKDPLEAPAEDLSFRFLWLWINRPLLLRQADDPYRLILNYSKSWLGTCQQHLQQRLSHSHARTLAQKRTLMVSPWPVKTHKTTR